MSSFTSKAIRPETGKLEKITLVDNDCCSAADNVQFKDGSEYCGSGFEIPNFLSPDIETKGESPETKYRRFMKDLKEAQDYYLIERVRHSFSTTTPDMKKESTDTKRKGIMREDELFKQTSSLGGLTSRYDALIIITMEIAQAHIDGESTSRLTSAYNRIAELPVERVPTQTRPTEDVLVTDLHELLNEPQFRKRLWEAVRKAVVQSSEDQKKLMKN